MPIRVLFLLTALAALSLPVACTGTRKAADKPLVPTAPAEAERAPPDAHLEEVRKNAAEQLDCPLEQTNVICVRRDSEGECVSVRADGCDKTFEYEFGDV